MTVSPDNFPSPGDLFEGRYQIERLIGSGGFSRVYLATQTDLGRKVALKIMMPVTTKLDADGVKRASTSASNKLAERFLQEARVVANLRGPYTVTVHDHGRTEDGKLFMVLEHVDGVSLSRLIKQEGALAPQRVARILGQALESLQEAHQHGLLHRDIKPANLMVYEHLGRADNVKVLDFGIAKVVGQQVDTENHEDLTQSGSLLGTPRYMSPEQLRGRELTPAADLYSLGLVAYEMLTGSKAIDSNSTVMIIGMQLTDESFAVPDSPHIPARLRSTVNRMLAKDTEARYSTADAVLADLSRLDTAAFPVVQLPSRVHNFTPMDHFPDLSDSIELARVEEIELRPEEPEPWRALMPPLIGVTALVLVLAGLLAYRSTHSDDTVDDVEPAGPVAAVELPVKPVVEEPVVPEEPDPPKEEPAVAITEMAVTTTPPNAELFVNGRSRGTSPVRLATSDVKFPAKIRAVAPGGGERLMVIDSAVLEVEIDLSMFAEVEQPKVSKSGGSKSGGSKSGGSKSGGSKSGGSKSGGSKSGGSKSGGSKSDGSKSDAKKDDSKGTLTLPALDY